MLENKYLIQYSDIQSSIQTLIDAYIQSGLFLDTRFSTYSAKLQLLMLDRVKHSVVCVSDSSDTDPDNNEDIEEFESHYMAVLNMTMEKYISLIEAMTAQRANLMNSITMSDTQETYYNDTPQGSSSEATLLDHLSTYTKNTNETTNPVGTLAQRLKEIEDNISHYWKAWSDEIISLLHLEDK